MTQAAPTPWQDLTRWPTTIVTGGGSGIGRALVSRLRSAGVSVIVIGRSEERLAALVRASPGTHVIAADLSNLERLTDLAARIIAAHPATGCLINNAGVQHNVRFDAVDYGCDAIASELASNLAAPLILTRALLPHLQQQPSACIVNVTSGLAFAPKRTAAVYSASKAGLHLFSRALRIQLAGTTVRVVEAVMPLVDTPMTAGRGRRTMAPDSAARQLLDGVCAGRHEVYVGVARFLPLMRRWAPGWLERVMQAGDGEENR